MALVEAVKAGDLDEVDSVVANAEEGEFLHVFVIQAIVMAIKSSRLDIVTKLKGYGAPMAHEKLSEALHLICEMTTPQNFSDAWRIIQLLVEGDGVNKISIDMPRTTDGWTPLCIACADACVPLVSKLIDLGADLNVITRGNSTP